ncbi:MAG: cobalamin biosynthesis protein CbiG, partial [Candidatus Sericytochromatia bacterium]|nr:cobalamin biosynthesis protein CbiG [Candidatus Sericytochromatia bacterium]
ITECPNGPKWFDAYVIIDWSANSTPKSGKDSIWFVVGTREGATLRIEAPINPRTRVQALHLLTKRLHALVAEGRRVLVGFDFPYGYPAGFGAVRGGVDSVAPWRSCWSDLQSRIVERDENGNNRFAVAAEINALCGPGPGPFWGCPVSAEAPLLTQTKGQFPHMSDTGPALPEYRQTEQRLFAGGRRPQAVWKLFTTGSVGSQSLVGIPMLAALREDPGLAPVSRVWPFETGFMTSPPAPNGPSLIHAEIWPGAVTVDESLHPIKDAAQVTSLLQYLAARDDGQTLAALFAPPIGLSEAAIGQCIDEEGWILGV